ncbi:MAG: peptide chain release factor N(5)-glutamine methyltransferase [Pseudorhodoplanes sp.]|nr:peptide chain release factor N(5)-glutamine methyltransferase [Pseudorhodoplanes sp.]
MPIASGATVATTRRTLAELFRRHDIDSAEADARILLAHALSVSAAQLAASPERILSGAEAERLSAYAIRRTQHEPVARITGEKEFWGLPLRVSARTLVPRPETETVVEAALEVLAGRHDAALRIADLGTGTGALLLALLHELPHAHGIATDLSCKALMTARSNAERLGLAERARFVCCNFGESLAGGFDLVVSNPPYIATARIEVLEPDVRDYDPRLALDGGRDGYDAYRAIAADARRLLASDGALVVELGTGQEATVRALMATRGLTTVASRCDLLGHARALILQAVP